jgi:hypothetical protein
VPRVAESILLCGISAHAQSYLLYFELLFVDPRRPVCPDHGEDDG